MQLCSIIAVVLCCVLSIVSAVSVPGNDKPIVTCAFKWAESPDDIFIYVKWAHKLDAPAVNNIRSDDVTVEIGEEMLMISADHPTKTMKLEIPFLHKISVQKSSHTKNTFGVNLVLRKLDIQEVWGSLLRPDVPVPRNIHTWWEIKNKYEDDNSQVKSGGSSISWLEKDPLGCEACKLTAASALFNPTTLEALRDLSLPSSQQSSPHSSYNQSLFKLLKHSCQSLSIPPRHEMANSRSVKVKGSSVGGRETGMTAAAAGLKEQVYRACVGLAKAKPKANRLLSALSLVHHTLFDIGDVAKGSLQGYPLSFLEVVASPAGREIVRKASDMACQEVQPSICSSSDKRAVHIGRPSIPKKKVKDECEVCRFILDEVEVKALRYETTKTSHLDGIQETKKPTTNGKVPHSTSVALDEIDNVCDEVKWRHFEDDVFDSTCQQVIEKKDDQLLAHLNKLFLEDDSSTSDVLTRAKSSSQIHSIHSDICGCKKQQNKKGKGKKNKNPNKEF